MLKSNGKINFCVKIANRDRDKCLSVKEFRVDNVCSKPKVDKFVMPSRVLIFGSPWLIGMLSCKDCLRGYMELHEEKGVITSLFNNVLSAIC